MTQEIIKLNPQLPAKQLYPLDRNPALVYLARLTPNSKITMRKIFKSLASLVHEGADYELVPWHELRYQHTAAIRAKLAERYSAATANLHLSALRGVLKEAWRLGYISAEDYQRAIDVEPVRGSKASQAAKGRHLSLGERAALLEACVDSTATGARDTALIALAYICGLRRAELVGLDLADYSQDTHKLTVRHGKGNKERVMPLEQGAEDALTDWLTVRGKQAGPLFPRILKGGHITEGRLSGQAVTHILSARGEQAGVKAFTPHDLRRTYAGDLLDAGADLSTVQKLMGHSDATTTSGYDRRGERAKAQAVQRLHTPYQRRAG